MIEAADVVEPRSAGSGVVAGGGGRDREPVVTGRAVAAGLILVVHEVVALLLLPRDGAGVGAGEDDAEELDEGEEGADGGVAEEDGHDLGVELVGHDGEAAVGVDLVGEEVVALGEGVGAAALGGAVAAGVGDGVALDADVGVAPDLEKYEIVDEFIVRFSMAHELE